MLRCVLLVISQWKNYKNGFANPKVQVMNQILFYRMIFISWYKQVTEQEEEQSSGSGR